MPVPAMRNHHNVKSVGMRVAAMPPGIRNLPAG